MSEERKLQMVGGRSEKQKTGKDTDQRSGGIFIWKGWDGGGEEEGQSPEEEKEMSWKSASGSGRNGQSVGRRLNF